MSNEPTETEQMLKYLLRQIIAALPTNRDWLDPTLERAAREMIK